MIKRSFAPVAVALTIVIGASLLVPATSHARWRGRGWYVPGAFAGGLLLGTALSRPYYYAPPPVYVYPPPAVVYTQPPPPMYVPNQAYAYPDPSIAPDPGVPAEPQGYASQPGQWVEVPGQYVNGRWVPPHKTFVPDNP